MDSSSPQLNRSSDNNDSEFLGPTTDVEAIGNDSTQVQLVNHLRSECEVFGFEEGELFRQRCDPLAKPFASNAATIIANAESMAGAVLRSCPDAPEYVRLESLLDFHNRAQRRTSVRESFAETQRVMARMQAVRIELAMVRLQCHSGGDLAAISYMSGTNAGSRIPSFCNTLGDGRRGFNPDSYCPMVSAIDGVLEGIHRHMKERMAQTGSGWHVGLVAERVRMLAECGYTDEASAMKDFLVRKSEDPSFPVPKEGPASYFLTHMYFRSRITSLMEYIKSVILHVHHKDAHDYAKLCLKMVSIIEATFVGVKEVWTTLKYVPLDVIMESLQS